MRKAYETIEPLSLFSRFLPQSMFQVLTKLTHEELWASAYDANFNVTAVHTYFGLEISSSLTIVASYWRFGVPRSLLMVETLPR